jgi:hypothetical protein
MTPTPLHTYRLFDVDITCDFPLPELPSADGTGAQIAVTMERRSGSSLVGFEKSFEFATRDGDVVCWCETRGADYLFVFPGQVSYLVTETQRIVCLPEPGCSEEWVRHLLINQVLPRLLGTTGRLVVHASAVTLPGNAGTVAFIGHSGFGKSTLASSFLEAGAELVSDDGVLISRKEETVFILGGMPGIRLLPDSRFAVFSESEGFRPFSEESSKYQLLLAEESDRLVREVRRLDAVFILDDPFANARASSVVIEPATARDAMVAFLQCLFSLDPTERQTLTQTFNNTTGTLAASMRIFRLSYPRRHDLLPEVRAAVTASLK